MSFLIAKDNPACQKGSTARRAPVEGLGAGGGLAAGALGSRTAETGDTSLRACNTHAVLFECANGARIDARTTVQLL